MMTFPIPVVPYKPSIGPGSQPLEDEVLITLDVPNDVHAFRPPLVELDAPPEVAAAALAFLQQLLAALRATPFAATQAVRFSLLDFAPAVRDEINELLGEGEVSILTAGDLRAQETAFTGIWRIHGEGIDDVEASAFPRALRELAMARQLSLTPAPVPPADLMNAPALHHEIRSLSAQWSAGRAAHVINLSLLPATPDDLAWLDRQLGRISFSILSRGFGNCRITATALPFVWWVQYFNNMEKLILNSLEIVDLPAVALAAAEDYAETIVRLDEWIASIESALVQPS
ncbi:hydrogenase expression/formation protein [Sulfuritalea sp.]|uniref:hydrogenase expression/formation protein n=1 Tax=Sulfuritalea sp. TaxID=2480090 RepID=UPI00286DD0BF|nr:hydrogenase expression/formation protein [Sulfuritalea sp.]